IFFLSSYFRLSLARPFFGIVFGFSISAFLHLGTWAVLANGHLSNDIHYRLDFLNIGVFQPFVFLLFYFLIFSHRASSPAASATVTPLLKEHSENLAGWNKELERLIHQ